MSNPTQGSSSAGLVPLIGLLNKYDANHDNQFSRQEIAQAALDNQDSKQFTTLYLISAGGKDGKGLFSNPNHANVTVGDLASLASKAGDSNTIGADDFQAAFSSVPGAVDKTTAVNQLKQIASNPQQDSYASGYSIGGNGFQQLATVLNDMVKLLQDSLKLVMGQLSGNKTPGNNGAYSNNSSGKKGSNGSYTNGDPGNTSSGSAQDTGSCQSNQGNYNPGSGTTTNPGSGRTPNYDNGSPAPGDNPSGSSSCGSSSNNGRSGDYGGNNNDCPPPPVTDDKCNTPPKPVAANEHARIWGDPHVIAANDSKQTFETYNFKGKGQYNILTDKDLAVNADMIDGPNGTTVMDKAGLTVGNRTVLVDAGGNVTVGSVDNKTPSTQLKDGQTIDLGNGSNIQRKGDKATLTTSEYAIVIEANQKWNGPTYLNIDVNSTANGVLADGVAPTGLLGETFNDSAIVAKQPKADPSTYRVDNLLPPTPTQANNPRNMV